VKRAVLHPRRGPEPGEQDHAEQCEHKTVQTGFFGSINEFTHIKNQRQPAEAAGNGCLQENGKLSEIKPGTAINSVNSFQTGISGK
jgi:hypothetical protein